MKETDLPFSYDIRTVAYEIIGPDTNERIVSDFVDLIHDEFDSLSSEHPLKTLDPANPGADQPVNRAIRKAEIFAQDSPDSPVLYLQAVTQMVVDNDELLTTLFTEEFNTEPMRRYLLSRTIDNVIRQLDSERGNITRRLEYIPGGAEYLKTRKDALDNEIQKYREIQGYLAARATISKPEAK